MNNLTKLAWPVVVIVVLVLFHKQIGAQFDRLTGVSISGTEFSVVLQNTAKSNNNEKTYDIIKGLSKEGIIALLGTGKFEQVLTYEDDDNVVRLEEDFNGFLDLEKNGLIEANTKLEIFRTIKHPDLEKALTQAGIEDIIAKLNKKGRYAFNIIVESVNTSINP